MTDIKIKRYADKENLKKLMKYSKATFVNKNGDTLGDAAIFNFPDSGRDFHDPANVFPLNRGGLHWTGQSDWVTLQAVETASDCLDLQAQFGDSPTNNSGVNGFGIVDCLGNVNARIDCLGNATFKSIHSDTGIYDLIPDGPEAHNAMWGGRDITAAFNNGTVSANIANGTFRDIFPGDYITKQVTISGTAYTVNWVIADCDYWINKGDQGNGMETHHVVIVPQVPIFSANMNATNTTEGGYMGSRMFKETIPACATGIVNAFGASHILTFRDFLISGMTANQISSGLPNFTGGAQWGASPWVSVQCDLMTEKMVLGAPVNSASALDEWCATRQMSAFRLSEKLINYNRQWYWLRNIVSSANFASVRGGGNASSHSASGVFGVRPFALLR